MSHTTHHSHFKSYLAVYAALVVLMIATVVVASIPLGVLAFPICIGIALSKMFLIMWIFMHVKDETGLIKVFAFIGIGWMGILFVFLMGDYLTRHNTVASYPGAWKRRGEITGAAHGHAADGHAAGHGHAPAEPEKADKH